MGQDDGVLLLLQFRDLLEQVQGGIRLDGQEAVLVQIGGGGMGRLGHDLVLDATDRTGIGFRSMAPKIGFPRKVTAESADKSPP